MSSEPTLPVLSAQSAVLGAGPSGGSTASSQQQRYGAAGVRPSATSRDADPSVVNATCPYGPQNMNARVTRPGRKHSPVSKGPLRPQVYPVYQRFNDPNVKPEALRVHPKGFKVLSKRSPLDRNITTYFRLPPRPAKRVELERQQLFRTASRIVQDEAVNGVILDGFMILTATGCKDPADAKECAINDSHVVDVVAEDLSYFTGLTFLDLGENQLTLGRLAPLSSLEELHLHCNMIDSLQDLEDLAEEDASRAAAAGGAPSGGGDAAAAIQAAVEAASRDGSFPRLVTLNLSFNHIPSDDVLALRRLPRLAALDLSCNHLRVLPPSLAELATLKRLALENNRFDQPSVILSLATLPALEELNLNYNAFQQWPTDVPADGFPVMRVLGLAANQITYFEDLYALKLMAATPRVRQTGARPAGAAAAPDPEDDVAAGVFPTAVDTGGGAGAELLNPRPLERVVLWGNPIEGRPKDRDILTYDFGTVDVHVVFQSPMPAKKKGKEFCQFASSHTDASGTTTPRIGLVTVAPVDSRGLDRLPGGSQRPRKPAGTTTSAAYAAPPAAQQSHDGTSFFVTAVDASSAHPNAASSATAASQQQPPHGGAATGSRTPSQADLLSGAAVGSGADLAGLQHQQPLGPPPVGWFGGAPAGGGAAQFPAPPLAHRSAGSASRGGGAAAATHPASLGTGAAFSDVGAPIDDDAALAALDICRPNATMRSVMNELKRALRQPLPPLPRGANATSHGGGMGGFFR